MQQSSTIQSQNQNQIPSWLKIGNFIDLKDKQGQWRVALILNITKTQIRVRYDGWPSKYDENFMINSSNIRPFRSVIRGYTGQVESPGPRQHYKFTQAYHKENFENKINDFLQNINIKSQSDINQFIRGSHYAWIDYLMSLTYNNQNQIALVYEYFFKHFQLIMLYFKGMLQQKNIQEWFKIPNNQKSEEAKKSNAFAESYYEIFDSVYSIMDCYPRLKIFFKSNQTLIANFVSGHTTHIQFMSEYLNQIGLHQIIQQVIQRINSNKQSNISLSFITAFTRLFSSIQKTIKDKQKKKQLAQKLCQIILLHCGRMSEISVKEQQNQLQKIYSTCKMMLLKYSWKSQFLIQFQLINVQAWKCMILSEKLQRKVKAINKLKNYYNNVSNSQKKQSFMIYNTKQTIEKQIQKQQILEAIFIGNQHHQIIKKGCQLVIQIYKEESITSDQLQIVWKSCRNRLEAVRKVMYAFFQQLCKDLRHKDLMTLAQWTVQEKLTQQIDKTFFYSLFKQVIESSNIPTMNFLFQFAEKRVYQFKEQVKQFSQLLTASKSSKAGFLQQYSNKIIKSIPTYKTNQDILFFLNFANQIYYDAKNKQLNLDPQCFNLVFQSLCVLLKTKVKKQDGIQFQKKKQKINQYLKLLQNLNSEFDVQTKQFMTLWQSFSQGQNQQIKQNVFLPWILDVTQKGVLKYQCLILNVCLKQKKFKKQIFTSIFKKHTHIDYINLSQMQFRIFKKFLIQVNADDGLLLQYNHWTGLNYFRLSQKLQIIDGLKQLNDIFLNCRNQHVVRKAANLLKQLHLNYSSSKILHNSELRIKKVEELLLKTQKYITDGVKKSNLRLIKNALYLLLDIALTVKEAFHIQHENISNATKGPKKTIKIIKDQKQLIQIEVVTSNTVKSLKRTICQHLNIPLYNLKMYKSFFEFKKIDDDGVSVASSASASASSHQSYPPAGKKQRNYSIIKNKVQQQIPNQYLYCPMWVVFSQLDQGIIVVESQNTIYNLIQKFVTQKVAEQLLKILADTDYYSKQTSQLAYSILIEVSSSNSTAFQILTNLINQLKIKSKNAESIGLSQQSVNFRMYFCKNMNRLTIQDLIGVIDQKNVGICSDIIKQLSHQITQSLQTDLLIQVLTIIKKGIANSKTFNSIFNPQSILTCLINLLQFVTGLKMAQQFKKQERNHQYINQMRVFTQCFNILQLIYHKNNAKIIEVIVENQHFLKIMTLLYKNRIKRQFGQVFAFRLDRAMKHVTKLNQKTQQILYHVIFNQVYYKVIESKTKKNSGFFKIIQDVISISSHEVIKRLFVRQDLHNGISFWQNCIKIIDQQSDFYNHIQKENKLLSGHLQIFSSLIKKNPSALNGNICQSILYNCLCYKQGYTIGKQIKCITKNSISAALLVLLTMCQTDEKYMRMVVSQLRKFQQTRYWRTPQFWNVNLQHESKSTTGFVGLQNPGCICYLNSFTQILFMNIQFRNQVVNFQPIQQSKDYSLLTQLRKIFLNLQYSNQKYLNPVPFTCTIKNTENKPMIKLFQQMDIQQYSSILFDKIQKLLPKDQDFVKQIFGGTYSNDIISKQCKHCSQRQESFLSMQLDVKSNLQQSLKTLVKGQLLQGQNAYFCQKCNKKVRALKRMSIKKLPNNLIICLKRFQYNFQTDQKFKINASCQFPRQITLQPYSQQFLSSDQQLQQFIKLQQAQTEQIQKLPHEYFEYKLKGVIIHKGSSESGHYYALIQVSSQNQKWLQFNDSYVTDFDIQNLAEQAYGSDDAHNPKYKNAYMLVYQRKKKLKQQLKTMQINPTSFSSSQIYSEQALKQLKQINIRNKQIQTFNMIFNQQYRTFVLQLLLHTLRINYNLWQQYKNQLKPTQTQQQHQSMVSQLSKINQYSQQSIEEVFKFYLEYCFFVKVRQTSIYEFVQNLKQLHLILKLKTAQPIINYFLNQLSQHLLLQELFVQISFKDKLVLMSHFIWGIIEIKLTNKYNQNQNGQNLYLLMKLVENMMCVMIQNGLCVNQLLYIIRSIADQDQKYLLYFQQINLFQPIYSILTGIKQSQQDKFITIEQLTADVDFILQREGSGQIQKKKKYSNQMEDIQTKNKTFQITVVKKTGKCLLKQESPQQAWNLLYLLYKFQSQSLNKMVKSYGSMDYTKQNHILINKRQQFQNQFIKLKDQRISHFIQQCQGSRAATSLSLFLCQVVHENKVATEKLIGIIKKSLKSLEATKFRPYLILLYYMIMHKDSLNQKRIQSFLGVLQYSLAENSKYFSQSDILHQWIMKLVLNSREFAQNLVRTDGGVQVLNEVMERLQSLKKPSAQLLKKQKNSTYERLNYQAHGLVVSVQMEDYETLFQTKKDFFMTLFHERPMSYELINQTKLLAIPQPNYQELVHKPKLGQTMFYMFIKKWAKVLIKLSTFGILRLGKVIKQGQNIKNTLKSQNSAWKKKDPEIIKKNIIKIKEVEIDLGQGYTIGQEQYPIWEMDQRLRVQITKDNQIMLPFTNNTNNNSKGSGKIPSQKKQNKMEIESSNSDLSYQSQSGNL